MKLKDYLQKIGKEMPKKKGNEAQSPADNFKCLIQSKNGLFMLGNEQEAMVYNLAIDDCKLYMAKREKENDRLKKDIELLELYLKNTRNDVLVLRKQLAKMLDVKRIEKILMDFVHPTMSYDTAKVNWRGLAQAIVNELGKGE